MPFYGLNKKTFPVQASALMTSDIYRDFQVLSLRVPSWRVDTSVVASSCLSSCQKFHLSSLIVSSISSHKDQVHWWAWSAAESLSSSGSCSALLLSF